MTDDSEDSPNPDGPARGQTPACSRCGFNIEVEEFVYSSQHMLRVQPTLLADPGDPWSKRTMIGEEFWVCGKCHQPGELILEVVKTGAAQERSLAEPPLPPPEFWPRDVLSYDSVKEVNTQSKRGAEDHE